MLFVIILFLIWKFMSTAHCVFAMCAHSEVMKGISRPWPDAHWFSKN